MTSVVKRPKEHNLWEQLAVEQFLRKMERYGFEVTEFYRFRMFYESLYFPGKRGMERYRLTGVQCFQFANIFGFWDGGRRVVREAVLFVPRKFSKTTSTAALAVWDLLFGDANAEAYTGANSQDQAKKCFDVIRGCVRRLDPRGQYYTVNEQIIKSRRADRTALAQCLTANARTKDGLNASTVIMDEFSQARDNNLLTVLTTSMGVRENPLTVIITTASDCFDGPFYDMLQGYKSVLLGEVEDDTLFAHLFEPDVDDPEDDPATWRKVQPHMGVTVTEDFYEREYKAALRGGADAMMSFRTKLLNIYANAAGRKWVDGDKIREQSLPIKIEELQGMPEGFVAVDLSVRDDFSAVTTGVWDEERGHMLFHTQYFFPEGALSGHPNERLYRKWAAAGHLTLTEGNVIDYGLIVEYILHINEYVLITGIGYDRYKSDEFVNMLRSAEGAEGVDGILRSISQTYGTFTAPVESFQYGLNKGAIWVDDNPITAYCFANAVLDEDRMGNMKPVKRTATQKIDGVITILMCLRQFMDADRLPEADAAASV